MGAIKPARKVKLFAGMLSGDRDLMRRAQQLLSRTFGRVDMVSGYYSFEETDYYAAELGEHVERQFVAFEQLISPDAIVDIKRETNELEQRICRDLALPDTHRPVNLDPGYMGLGKLVLATTKDQAHRIYVGRGIYAESTMRYHDGSWRAWPWTYPDFACGQYAAFFLEMRELLKSQLATRHSDQGADKGG